MTSIKDKIRRLLAVSKDDSAAQGEIENALRLAETLLARHNLDRAEIERTQGPQSTEMSVVKKPQAATKRCRWDNALTRYVVEFVGSGVGVYHESTPTPLKTPSGIVIRDDDGEPVCRSHYVFYGEAEAVEIAGEVYEELSKAVIALARLQYGSVFRGKGAVYAQGFMTGLTEQLREKMRRELSGTAESPVELTGSSAYLPIAAEDRRALIELHKTKQKEAREWLRREVGVSLTSAPPLSGANVWNNAAAFDLGKKHGKDYEHEKPIRGPKRIGTSGS